MESVDFYLHFNVVIMYHVGSIAQWKNISSHVVGYIFNSQLPQDSVLYFRP